MTETMQRWPFSNKDASNELEFMKWACIHRASKEKHAMTDSHRRQETPNDMYFQGAVTPIQENFLRGECVASRPLLKMQNASGPLEKQHNHQRISTTGWAEKDKQKKAREIITN